ncbi:hypothetical protein BC833DRAFT_513976, partial [Globomyces pollinis-pini]
KMKLTVILSLAFTAIAFPQKKTFITDVCKSDADCASDCCAFTTGKCAGGVVALQRDGGCGFGDPTPNARAARAAGAVNAAQEFEAKIGGGNAAPSKAVVAPAKTFITDVCQSDDGCQSGCCAFRTGKCAGAVVALDRDGGCGFGNATPNANAARA